MLLATGLAAEQKTRQEAFRRARRAIIGIGVSFFTEIVGAGPSAIATFLVLACSIRPRSASIRPARSWREWHKSQAKATRHLCPDHCHGVGIPPMTSP